MDKNHFGRINFPDCAFKTYIVDLLDVNTLLAEHTIDGRPIQKLTAAGCQHTCNGMPPQTAQVAICQFSGSFGNIGFGESSPGFGQKLVQLACQGGFLFCSFFLSAATALSSLVKTNL